MSAQPAREFGPHPLTIIAEAIQAARIQGIRVRIGSHGVECPYGDGPCVWIRDQDDDGVDPIGAAILLKQPDVADVDEAAARAVNAPIPWAAGCSDGLQRRRPADAWATSIKARFYAAGFEAGTWLRMQLLQKVGPRAGGGKVA